MPCGVAGVGCWLVSYPLGSLYYHGWLLMSKRRRALKAVFRKHYYFNGNLWRVNARKSGIYTEVLKPILEQLFSMRQHHNKLLVVRFDLHQSHATESSDHVSWFMDKLTKRLKRKYKLCRVGYIWVREQEKSKHQHYHLVLMIDGNKEQFFDEILKIATLKMVIWRISYLAKGKTWSEWLFFGYPHFYYHCVT